MLVPFLLLIGAAVCLSGMSLLRKEYDKRNGQDMGATYSFILISFLISALFCTVYFAISRTFGIFAEFDGTVLVLGIAYALCTFLSTIVCIVSASYGSVAMIVAFANLGIITFSTLYGLIFDNARNQPTVLTWLGLALALTVMLINLFESGKSDTESDARKKRIFKLFCIAIFFTNGPALVLFSMVTRYRPAFGSFHFMFVYSLVCALLALAMLCVLMLKKSKKTNEKAEKMRLMPRIGRISLIVIAAYAALTTASEVMALINTTQLPIIVQAPLSFAIPVVILTVVERIVYKTPITKSVIVKLALCLGCCTLLAF